MTWSETPPAVNRSVYRPGSVGRNPAVGPAGEVSFAAGVAAAATAEARVRTGPSTRRQRGAEPVEALRTFPRRRTVPPIDTCRSRPAPTSCRGARTANRTVVRRAARWRGRTRTLSTLAPFRSPWLSDARTRRTPRCGKLRSRRSCVPFRRTLTRLESFPVRTRSHTRCARTTCPGRGDTTVRPALAASAVGAALPWAGAARPRASSVRSRGASERGRMPATLREGRPSRTGPGTPRAGSQVPCRRRRSTTRAGVARP